MRLLLGSGGLRTADRRARFVARMREHFGDVRRVIFVPWALADHDGYVRLIREAGLDAGYEHVGLHTFDDPVQAVLEAEAVSVGGGNTFRLTQALQATGVMDALRRRVVEDGMPYQGVSAGSNVACPTMMTTNDMPIVQPSSFETLGLVPFQINAHYFDGQVHVLEDGGLVEHFGETRDQRIAEFHEEPGEANQRPVVGLREGASLVRVGDGLRLVDGGARLFVRGEVPRDLEPDEDLSGLLS